MLTSSPALLPGHFPSLCLSSHGQAALDNKKIHYNRAKKVSPAGFGRARSWSGRCVCVFITAVPITKLFALKLILRAVWDSAKIEGLTTKLLIPHACRGTDSPHAYVLFIGAQFSNLYTAVDPWVLV